MTGTAGHDHVEGSDAPATAATPLALAAGEALSGTLAPGGDADWVAVTLLPGEAVVLDLRGEGPVAPAPFGLVLSLRDASGTLVQAETGYGAGWSRLAFTHPGAEPRSYFVEVAAFGASDTGGYRLTRGSPAPAAPVDPAALAGQLAGDGPGWAPAPDGTIAVDLSRLDAAAQAGAREGLEAWGRITGLAFREVALDPAAPAGLLFDADPAASFTTLARDGSGAIAMAWVTLGPAAGTGEAGLAEVLHEIGHALGLAEAAAVPPGAPVTVMQAAAAGAPLPLTPLAADAAAAALLYGTLPGAPGAGDDVYGPGTASAEDGGPYGALAERLAGGAALIVDAGGQDRLDLSAVAAPQRIDLAPGALSDVAGGTGNLTLAPGTLIEAAAGGSGADTILGNAAANLLEGGAGDDWLDGGEGPDTLEGGDGADRLDGGAGDDWLTGGPGADLFVFRSRGGADTVSGFDPAEDRLWLADPTDPRITLTPGPDGVTLVAEDGGRMLLSGVAADLIGPDSFVWSRPERLVFGTAGADRLAGGPGGDVVFGGAGGDVLQMTGGADTLDGGFGRDEARAPKTTRVNLDLAVTGPQAFAGGQVTLRSVEDLVGSTTGDTLRGTDAGNRLQGLGGFDLLDGRGGMDTLVGGFGRDRLYGGTDWSRDTFVFDTIYDSKPDASRDLVFDFISGVDRIDVSGIDANVFRQGNQAFAFTNIRAAPYAVWTVDIGRNLLVRGDVNGDARHEFEIEVVGIASLGWKDFIL